MAEKHILKKHDGKKTISQWCIILEIRLLDTSYYKDKKEYTVEEFEDKVPRNIQV